MAKLTADGFRLTTAVQPEKAEARRV